MNYYKVLAKCGHVKKNNYILKMFYVYAISKKEAAAFVRNMSRVKHHHKDAIRDVTEITFEEYLEGNKRNADDPYLMVHNSSDQRKLCDFSDDEIIREPEVEPYKKKTHAKRRLIELAFIREWRTGGVLAYE